MRPVSRASMGFLVKSHARSTRNEYRVAMLQFLKKYPKNLHDVLNYRNELVTKSFSKRIALPEFEVQQIFQETLKWLWLCRVHEDDRLKSRRNNYAPPD